MPMMEIAALAIKLIGISHQPINITAVATIIVHIRRNVFPHPESLGKSMAGTLMNIKIKAMAEKANSNTTPILLSIVRIATMSIRVISPIINSDFSFLVVIVSITPKAC